MPIRSNNYFLPEPCVSCLPHAIIVVSRMTVFDDGLFAPIHILACIFTHHVNTILTVIPAPQSAEKNRTHLGSLCSRHPRGRGRRVVDLKHPDTQLHTTGVGTSVAAARRPTFFSAPQLSTALHSALHLCRRFHCQFLTALHVSPAAFCCTRRDRLPRSLLRYPNLPSCIHPYCTLLVPRLARYTTTPSDLDPLRSDTGPIPRDRSLLPARCPRARLSLDCSHSKYVVPCFWVSFDIRCAPLSQNNGHPSWELSLPTPCLHHNQLITCLCACPPFYKYTRDLIYTYAHPTAPPLYALFPPFAQHEQDCRPRGIRRSPC